MLLGIGVIGAFTATVASFFVQQDEGAEMAAIEARLERIERKLDALARSGRRRRRRGTPTDPESRRWPGRRRRTYGALASISGVVSSVCGPFSVQTAYFDRYIETPAYSPLTLKA